MGKAEIFKYITRMTPTRIAVSGGTAGRNAVIGSVAQELREFLSGYKGKYISKEEILDFYHSMFPELKLSIKNIKPEMVFASGTPKASTSIRTTNDLSKLEDVTLELHSQSFLDKLKSLFHIKNTKKDFYVDSAFVDSMCHEGTHAIQEFTKPNRLLYSRGLRDVSPSENWSNALGIDNYFAYISHVYKEEFLPFRPEKFRTGLMGRLCAPYYTKEPIVLVQLKNLIREAQGEKQAYELGLKESSMFKYPRLAKIDFFRNYFENQAVKETESCFDFGKKIDIMKKEYFAIIKQERAKHKAMLDA